MPRLILLQAGMTLTDQGLIGLFAITFTAIFAGFAFTWSMHNHASARFETFIDRYNSDRIRFLEEWIPVRDARLASRQVALANALAPHVNENNPFSDYEMALNRLAWENVGNLTEEHQVSALIRAWDRHLRDEGLSAAARTEAQIILRELNGYLEELRARAEHRAEHESQPIPIVAPAARQQPEKHLTWIGRLFS